MLRGIKLCVKNEKFITFEATLHEVYETLDNSAAIKNRIPIENSIYVFDDFDSNRQVKEAEARMRTKKKSREAIRGRFHVSRMVNFGSPGNLLSIRRRSRTLDLSSMLSKKYRPPSPAQATERSVGKNKLSNVFFLVNFLQIENDFEDQNDFTKFYIDFYFQVRKDFSEFTVGFDRRPTCTGSSKSARRSSACRGSTRASTRFWKRSFRTRPEARTRTSRC